MDVLRDNLIECAGRCRGQLQRGGLLDIIRFIYSQQDASGGFRGRGHGPDLYYTIFALQSLLALGQQPPCRDVGDWLMSLPDPAPGNRQDLCSYIRCRVLVNQPFSNEEQLAFSHLLQEHFPFEGTSTESLGNASLLDAFLVLGACRDLGIPPPSDATIGHLLYITARAGGAFAATPHADEPTTVATVAGCILAHLCAVSSPQDDTRHWLRSRRSSEGGYVAAVGVQEPDLLSTGTVLYTLRSVYRADLSAEMEAIQSFTGGLWDESGGFAAHPCDPIPDLEHTFYALVALGACHKK